MENRLEFFTSKRRMLKLIVISSIIILIGFFCTKSDKIIIEVIGYLNFVLGISIVSIGLYNLFDNSPQLILTDSGIEHKKITKNVISWSEISNAEITKEKNNNIIILYPKGNLSLDNFKFIFRNTAKFQIKKNIIKLNIQQLEIDYSKLNSFLHSRLN
jgi:hypothetical protein